MAPEQKLQQYKDDWVRQMVGGGVSSDTARNIVAIAEFNGMFDPLKLLFAIDSSDHPLLQMGEDLR